MATTVRKLLTALLVLSVGLSVFAGGVSAENANPEAPEVDVEIGDPLTILKGTGNGVDDSIVRLYEAVFARTPDEGGLAYWISRYRNGQRLSSIAGYFTRSQEFQARFGHLNSGDFVKLLYRHVLGREPDLPGYNYWAPRLENGTFSQGGLVVQFSESPEFVSLTGTLPPEAPPAVVPANSGHGRRVIYCVSCQYVWLVEADGTLTRDYPVSGRVNTPAPGTYSVFSKSPLAWAGHGGITMEYMVRYTWGRRLALGFHSIPKRPNGTFLQTEAELGQYRSAGCTRQRLEDAKFLYDWAPVGTKVVVLR